jgi:Pentapeptide repeats (8 copies)
VKVFNLTSDDSAAAQYRPLSDRRLNDSPCLDYDGEQVTAIRFDMPIIHGGESTGRDGQERVSLVVTGDFAAMTPQVAAKLHGIVGVVIAHVPSLALMGFCCEASRVYLVWQGSETARSGLKVLVEGNQVELFGASIGVIAFCEAPSLVCQPINAHGLRNLLIAEIRSKGAVDCDLTGVDLCCGDLSGANLANANLSGANLQGVKLCGANLNGANLNLSRLSDVDFSGATLVGAKLIGAKVIGANLSDADLTQANLSNANFSKSNLTRTNLDRAKMTAARFVYSRGLSRDEQAELEQRRGAIF